MKPLISVIVPVYNVQDYLFKCLESLLLQTHENLEIILIDDGSDDMSPLICDMYAEKYDNIVVAHQPNSGPSNARNTGLQLSRGEYIAFVDSDDYIKPIYIEYLLRQVIFYNVKIGCCGYAKSLDKLDHGELSILSYGITLSDSEAFNRLLDNQEFCAPWAKLYSRDILTHVSFREGVLFEDMFFSPEVFKLAKCIAVSDTALYYYNQDSSSIVRSNLTYSKLIQYLEGIEYWIGFARINYPDLVRETSINYYKNTINICKEIKSEQGDSFVSLYSRLRNDILGNGGYILCSKEFSLKYKVKFVLIMLGIY